jgi:hypothetical protein
MSKKRLFREILLLISGDVGLESFAFKSSVTGCCWQASWIALQYLGLRRICPALV